MIFISPFLGLQTIVPKPHTPNIHTLSSVKYIHTHTHHANVARIRYYFYPIAILWGADSANGKRPHLSVCARVPGRILECSTPNNNSSSFCMPFGMQLRCVLHSNWYFSCYGVRFFLLLKTMHKVPMFWSMLFTNHRSSCFPLLTYAATARVNGAREFLRIAQRFELALLLLLFRGLSHPCSVQFSYCA